MIGIQLTTYALRRWVNQIVDATMASPSLAEMVQHHLDIRWRRLGSRIAYYSVQDCDEVYLDLRVVDASGYPDDLYERARALIRVGVNGALLSPADEASVAQWFPNQAFRTCPHCQKPFQSWFDYYGHLHLDHFPLAQ